MLNNKSDELRAKILKWAGEIRSWRIPWHTGIYPGEMAAFLGLCDLCGIRSIIESGRGDHAYSTRILGKFADQTDVKITSIDFSPVEGNTFQEPLRQYCNLQCIVGNAFDVLPDVAREVQGPIALLLDGPKLEPANRLSLVASYMFDIHVVAHHNCPLEAPWGKEFSQIFPCAFHYEVLGLAQIPEWQEFKQWENGCVNDYEMYDEVHRVRGRSLGYSSLAMGVLSDNKLSKRRFLELRIDPLRYHPWWLWLKWSLRGGKSSR